MDKKITKQDVIALAQHVKHNTELLIAQCESWLSEEEGMRNMEKRIRERRSNRKKL